MNLLLLTDMVLFYTTLSAITYAITNALNGRHSTMDLHLIEKLKGIK
jgi:hypothetical protein